MSALTLAALTIRGKRKRFDSAVCALRGFGQSRVAVVVTPRARAACAVYHLLQDEISVFPGKARITDTCARVLIENLIWTTRVGAHILALTRASMAVDEHGVVPWLARGLGRAHALARLWVLNHARVRALVAAHAPLAVARKKLVRRAFWGCSRTLAITKIVQLFPSAALGFAEQVATVRRRIKYEIWMLWGQVRLELFSLGCWADGRPTAGIAWIEHCVWSGSARVHKGFKCPGLTRTHTRLRLVAAANWRRSFRVTPRAPTHVPPNLSFRAIDLLGHGQIAPTLTTRSSQVQLRRDHISVGRLALALLFI